MIDTLLGHVTHGLRVIEAFVVDELRISPLTFFVLVAFLSAFAICLCCCLPCLLCCISRRRRRCRNDNRRSLFNLMFAKIDEFESLTPLILSPTSEGPSLPQAQPTAACRREHVAFRPTKQQLIRAASTSDSSPPPPRRPMSTKTLIVPLTSVNTRQPRHSSHALVMTPDSRVTTFDCGTTKSCATIPEDDELSLEEESEEETTGVDLVSIDRTYASRRQPCTAVHSQSWHQFNPHAPLPEAVPFKEKAPLYEPPAPPWEPSAPAPQRRAVMKLAGVGGGSGSGCSGSGSTTRPRPDSPGLSSPDASSLGSPEDTTGSLSDSFVMPSEGTGAAYSLDTGEQRVLQPGTSGSAGEDSGGESKKYALHRIEEESEHGDDIGAASSIVSGSTHNGSAHMGTGVLRVHGDRIPRSISQQLALMKR